MVQNNIKKETILKRQRKNNCRLGINALTKLQFDNSLNRDKNIREKDYVIHF